MSPLGNLHHDPNHSLSIKKKFPFIFTLLFWCIYCTLPHWGVQWWAQITPMRPWTHTHTHTAYWTAAFCRSAVWYSVGVYSLIWPTGYDGAIPTMLAWVSLVYVDVFSLSAQSIDKLCMQVAVCLSAICWTRYFCLICTLCKIIGLLKVEGELALEFRVLVYFWPFSFAILPFKKYIY